MFFGGGVFLFGLGLLGFFVGGFFLVGWVLCFCWGFCCCGVLFGFVVLVCVCLFHFLWLGFLGCFFGPACGWE